MMHGNFFWRGAMVKRSLNLAYILSEFFLCGGGVTDIMSNNLALMTLLYRVASFLDDSITY